ncbi:MULTISPECIES: MFS transporter [unclassified Bacillus (in: firmicutes)]|uniref:MFS transporter n=1 Tax=unclassified Bacillus (in: firmicutes) TaxID=185979 RepID=UPI0008F16667|nr:MULTISPECIES: MFS transporter [unclassified Bacillus (in: firmicutes)]SFK13469.1 Predicted arabinose efflux permease, MFS family [Bacillus sp. 71mf]SFT24175.1 Predicted arabinose efflux permease, MFS family [Bacillus sp. 103mf]
MSNTSVLHQPRVESLNMLIFTVTRFLSEMGSSIFKFALSLYVLDVTGSPTAFSMVLGFSIIPGILVNIFAGVYIDKHDKKKIIIFSEVFSGLLLLIFFGAFKFFSLDIVSVTIFTVLLSLIQAFCFLTLNASIANIVNNDKVASVNSSYQTIGAVINVVGPILGAVIYRLIDLEMIVLIYGIVVILSGFFQVFLKFKRKTMVEENKSYTESFKEVYRYINKQTAVKYLLVAFFTINFVLTPLLQVVLPYVIYQKLDLSGQGLSIIQSSYFVGIIIGALLVSRKKIMQAVIDKIFILFQIQALLFMMWCFPNFLSQDFLNITLLIIVIYCIIISTTGIFNALANIPMTSHIQIHTPENIRASFFGVVSSITSICTPIGMWLYGILLEGIDWFYIPITSGVIVLMVGFLANRNEEVKSYFSKETLEQDIGLKHEKVTSH